MMMQKETADWFDKLYASRDVGALAKVLAAALGELSGGDAVGVFLLNESKTDLLLFASWTAEQGAKREALQSVPLTDTNDPLCFSLHLGLPYQAVLQPTATMALLHSGPGDVYVCPFKSQTNGALGGFIITSKKKNPVNSLQPIRMIGLYASSLIEGMLLERSEAIVDSLRNDIARLEKHKKMERDLAITKIAGTSEAMAHVRSLIIKTAPTIANVLITGETGTGKELTADAIHALSSRKDAPFLKINCGALAPNLLESELFGYVKGAFTGADSDHQGLMRSANGGSVLLDEIGDMPVELQVKLLRVLQEQKIRPVGDSKEYPIDVRIIAATNKDLQLAMTEGSFRKDLYHRLAALHIHIPPLRERRQDIPVLAAHFLKQLCRKHGREELSLPLEACMHLSSLKLEGNARELANMVERSLLLSDTLGGCVSFSDTNRGSDSIEGRKLTLADLLREYEADLLRKSLKQHDDNIAKTAEALGIPRSTLRSKLSKSTIQ